MQSKPVMWVVPGLVVGMFAFVTGAASSAERPAHSSSQSLRVAQAESFVAMPYLWAAERSAEGAFTLSGYVPSDVLQESLNTQAGNVADDTTIVADGEPEGFAADARAGMAALTEAREGRVSYTGSEWALVARVDSEEQRDAVRETLGDRTDAWKVAIDVADPPPPEVSPYVWTAFKRADGGWTFSGHVPTAAFVSFLDVRAEPAEANETEPGSGAPDDFSLNALAAIGALESLQSGAAGFDGVHWYVRGTAPADVDRDALLANAGTPAEEWQTDIVTADDGAATAEAAGPEDRSEAETVDAINEMAAPADAAVPSAEESAKQLTEFLERDAGSDGDTRDAPDEPIESGEGNAADAVNEMAAPANDAVQSAEESAEELNELLSQDEGAADSSGEMATGAATDDSVEAINEMAAPAAETSASDAAEELMDSLVDEPAAADGGTGDADDGSAADAVDAINDMAEPARETSASEAAGELSEFLADEGRDDADGTPAGADETPDGAADDSVEQAAEDESGEELLYRFSADKTRDSAVSLYGVVPAEATRRYLGVVAGSVPVDGVYIHDDAPEGFAGEAAAGVRALKRLESGELLHEHGMWSLTGTAQNAETREAIRTDLAAAADTDDWQVDLDVVPPIEVCRKHVESLAADNRILFGAGSSRLTESSQAAVDRLATYLGECPGTEVHVEGHTDADGPEDLNLELSVARAEAVVAELVARGVSAERLYAVGYGESLPIAPNDTREGKRRNRRIAFEILDEAD